jgi:hypothetical protein
MTRAAAQLEKRSEAITSRALAQAAHISLNTACTRARDSARQVRWRLNRCYQFCNIALIALPITCLWPRTAPAPRYQIARQQRWTRPRLRPRHRTASRSGLLSRGSAQRPATDSSGAGAREPGSVRCVRRRVIAEREDPRQQRAPQCARATLPPEKRGRAIFVPFIRGLRQRDACACAHLVWLAIPPESRLWPICHTSSRSARATILLSTAHLLGVAGWARHASPSSTCMQRFVQAKDGMGAVARGARWGRATGFSAALNRQQKPPGSFPPADASSREPA